MPDVLRKKDIEDIVKKNGRKFTEWKDEVVTQARMSIIDKTGDEYKNWENDLLQRKAIEMLLDQTLVEASESSTTTASNASSTSTNTLNQGDDYFNGK